jgi:hypothetical protein
VFDWASQGMSWRIFAEIRDELIPEKLTGELVLARLKASACLSPLLCKAQTHLSHPSLPHSTNAGDTTSEMEQPCTTEEQAWPCHRRAILGRNRVAFVALCHHGAATSCDVSGHLWTGQWARQLDLLYAVNFWHVLISVWISVVGSTKSYLDPQTRWV